MKTYILILTLNAFNAGGVSMAEFQSQAACIDAGRLWVSRINEIELEKESFYICAKKS